MNSREESLEKLGKVKARKRQHREAMRETGREQARRDQKLTGEG